MVLSCGLKKTGEGSHIDPSSGSNLFYAGKGKASCASGFWIHRFHVPEEFVLFYIDVEFAILSLVVHLHLDSDYSLGGCLYRYIFWDFFGIVGVILWHNLFSSLSMRDFKCKFSLVKLFKFCSIL